MIRLKRKSNFYWGASPIKSFIPGFKVKNKIKQNQAKCRLPYFLYR